MDKLRILCMAIFFCYSKNKLTSILEQLIFYVMIFLSLFYQYTLIQSYRIRIFVLNIRFYYNFKEIVDVYRTKESSWLQSRNVIVQKWQPFLLHCEFSECANFLLLESASFHVWNFALQFLTDMLFHWSLHDMYTNVFSKK